MTRLRRVRPGAHGQVDLQRVVVFVHTVRRDVRALQLTRTRAVEWNEERRVVGSGRVPAPLQDEPPDAVDLEEIAARVREKALRVVRILPRVESRRVHGVEDPRVRDLRPLSRWWLEATNKSLTGHALVIAARGTRVGEDEEEHYHRGHPKRLHANLRRALNCKAEAVCTDATDPW